MYQPRLTQLQQVIRGEIDAGLYHGAVVRVARGGEIVFDTVAGSAQGAGQQPLARKRGAHANATVNGNAALMPPSGSGLPGGAALSR